MRSRRPSRSDSSPPPASASSSTICATAAALPQWRPIHCVADQGAPVALPLAWSDLSKLQRADAFTLRDAPETLRRRCKDPWAGMDRIQQNLARWAEQDED
ncbi:hypothetical protein [Xanthomonas oryzae]|uniref:non-homologous end-joining DNA ligase LigD n=1 Tax=Xanthomonas oryzae TaxID=347 RepID=UPI000A9157B7